MRLYGVAISIRAPVFSGGTKNQIALCTIARFQLGYTCDIVELKRLISEYVKFSDIQNTFKEFDLRIISIYHL